MSRLLHLIRDRHRIDPISEWGIFSGASINNKKDFQHLSRWRLPDRPPLTSKVFITLFKIKTLLLGGRARKGWCFQEGRLFTVGCRRACIMHFSASSVLHARYELVPRPHNFSFPTFFTDEETNIISLSRDTKIVKLYWNYSIDPKRRKGVSDETRCCSYSSASRAFPSREGDAFPGRRRVGRGALLIRARAWRGWSLGRVVQRSQPPDWPGGARWPPRGNSALPAFLPLFLRPRNEDPSLAFARNLLPRYIYTYTPSCSLLSFFRI